MVEEVGGGGGGWRRAHNENLDDAGMDGGREERERSDGRIPNEDDEEEEDEEVEKRGSVGRPGGEETLHKSALRSLFTLLSVLPQWICSFPLFLSSLSEFTTYHILLPPPHQEK